MHRWLFSRGWVVSFAFLVRAYASACLRGAAALRERTPGRPVSFASATGHNRTSGGGEANAEVGHIVAACDPWLSAEVGLRAKSSRNGAEGRSIGAARLTRIARSGANIGDSGEETTSASEAARPQSPISPLDDGRNRCKRRIALQILPDEHERRPTTPWAPTIPSTTISRARHRRERRSLPTIARRRSMHC